MPTDFARTIEVKLKIKGRLVVSGIGKSRYVGGRIVAKLTSTGTPASSVHVTEASDGNLKTEIEAM